MKIYTILSPSHKFLFDNFFLPSLNKHEPNCELIVIDQEQICETGNYYDSGWKESMEQKIDVYLQAVNETEDKFFIWSDVDIEFYDSFINQCIEELGDHDIAFQEGVGNECCAGFFIAKINDRTKKFFQLLKEKYHNYTCDQQAINANIRSIDATFLSKQFLNISFQHRQWNGQYVSLNDPIVMFHANYTVGLQHKIMLLSRIRDRLENMALNKKNSQPKKNKSNIKIINAFYGLYSDVTENLLQSDNEIVVSIDALRSDPVPGGIKFLYCFDKDNKILNRPIREGLSVRLI